MPMAVLPVDPTRLRRIEGSFSWLDHRLISQGWLDRLRREEILLYLFWVLVGDRHGVSFYASETIAARLKISVAEIEQARSALVAKGLLAYRRGIVQVLALPSRRAW
jgi:hypothetical protein